MKKYASTIEFLSRYVEACKRFDYLTNKRAEKMQGAIYKGPRIDGTGPGKSYTRKDRIAEALASVEMIDNAIAEAVTVMCEVLTEIENVIENSGLDYNEMLILQWRYINGAPWEEISKHTGFSISHCFLLHDKALKTLLENENEKKEENE